ncbi:hypothetical protein ARTHROSP310_24400 [Arthrobacter sp. AD-310]
MPAAPAATPPAHRSALRVFALAAGSTVAATGVLVAGVYAAAGDPATGVAADASAAFSQVSAQTPADGRALTAEQVGGLRAEGWACPELEAMGFHLESARAMVIDGQPAVLLRLTDGSHYATVTEQHPAGQAQAGGVQLDGTSPWSAIYRAPGRTFTYVSDLPSDRADDALPILQRLGSQAAAGLSAGVVHGDDPAGSGEALGTRLQRGINNIVALFTRT